MLGDFGAYNDMRAVSGDSTTMVTTMVFFYVFTIVTSILLLNILLAILVDSYTKVKDSSGDAESMTKELYKMMGAMSQVQSSNSTVC
jgi:hypothetical protein